MNSSDLPITDWWDPEWDVYDVPIAPDNVPYDVWWPAYFHQAWIEWLMTGRTWGWPDGLLARQLTQHAYPGQPSTRLPPTTADKVMDVVAQLGVDLQPWQERAIRGLYPITQPTQPCSCWYTYLCCGLMVDRPEDHQLLAEYGYQLGHSATGFVVNPQCPQHGTTGPQ